MRHSSQQVVAVGSRGDRGAAAGSRRDSGSSAPTAATRRWSPIPSVDVVYVATPHNVHLPCAVLALEAGKHTLVEKPLGLERGAGPTRSPRWPSGASLFCMEAYWTAFLPKFDVLRQILDSRVLGEITAVVADFGEWFRREHRIHRLELAGGPMLDLGTYLVSFVVDVLGSAGPRAGPWRTNGSGVNGQTAMIISRGAQLAVLHTTILSNTPTAATIAGTRATISIDGPFYQPGGFTLTASDGHGSLRYDEPRIGHGALHLQAAEVARRIHAGETGSPLRPLSVSIEVLAGDGRDPTADRRPLPRRVGHRRTPLTPLPSARSWRPGASRGSSVGRDRSQR